jgi:hypothetical protein
MSVEVELDRSGSVASVSVVDAQQIAREPFARPFVVHPKASWLNAMPLAFVVLSVARLLYNINRAAGDVGANGEVTSLVQDPISLGSGGYILLAAGAYLAYRAFRGQ